PHLHDRRGSESAAQARGQVRKLRPAFFFSSRRRHTRLQGDWSSDVCSSDLAVHDHVLPAGAPGKGPAEALSRASNAQALVLWLRPPDVAALASPPPQPAAVYMSGLMGGMES